MDISSTLSYNRFMQLLNYPQDYLDGLKKRMESRFKVNEETGCWEWTAGKFPYGYGKISVKHRSIGAHRVYYQLTKGQIEDGLVIDHLCRNPSCINPDHLEPVTQWENNRRGIGISAENLVKTHCKHGHEFTPENTWTFASDPKRRKCRTCELAGMRRRDKERALRRAKLGLTTKGTPRIYKARQWRI